MSNRIKFDFTNNIKKTETELLELIASFIPEITPTDCYLARSYCLVTFIQSPNIAKIFDPETINKFENANIKPKPPKAYYTERSIFLNNIRPYITCLSGKELIENFNKFNKDMKAMSIYTVSPPNANKHTLKITLTTKEAVEKALVEGVRLRGMLIESHNIQREKTENLTQCYRCFSFDHNTNKCSSTEQSCSICTGKHSYQSCPDKENNDKYKCANCGGNHISIARSCPKRKEIIKQQQQ